MIADHWQKDRAPHTFVTGMIDRCVIKHELPISQRDRFAPHLQIQYPSAGKDRIPRLFRIHALHTESPKKCIFGIDNECPLRRFMMRLHLIRARTENQPIEFLDRPTRFDEPSGEVIEQFRMRGSVS